MTEDEFAFLLPRLRPYSDYLYFHLMGEPLLHPKLERFLALAGECGFRVILTTNGTLLAKQQETLLNAPGLHKVNISLHSFEANDSSVPFQTYLEDCFRYGVEAAGKKLTVYRLWNQGGLDAQNAQILRTMESFFPKPWKVEPRGTRIGDRVYLEYGEKFDWPDLNAPEYGSRNSCMGLRDQIGVLCDGTVVPCCLDHDGSIPLGNLFQEELESILQKPKATQISQGFACGFAAEPLCRHCGFAQRFR